MQRDKGSNKKQYYAIHISIFCKTNFVLFLGNNSNFVALSSENVLLLNPIDNEKITINFGGLNGINNYGMWLG